MRRAQPPFEYRGTLERQGKLYGQLAADMGQTTLELASLDTGLLWNLLRSTPGR